MNINDVFPSKFLKAADLQGNEPTVIINRCEVESIGDQRKLVLYFQGKEKGMICNRTNADRIAFMYSPDTDNWLGKPITLFTDMVSFQGKTMQALRVKPPKAEQPRRMSATAPQADAPKYTPYIQQRERVVEQRPNYKLSHLEGGKPDVDELPEDEVPF